MFAAVLDGDWAQGRLMMDGSEKTSLLRKLLDRAGDDPKYRSLLTVSEEVSAFMRDHPDDPDVVAYRDAEPSPPAGL